MMFDSGGGGGYRSTQQAPPNPARRDDASDRLTHAPALVTFHQQPGDAPLRQGGSVGPAGGVCWTGTDARDG
jgi:hypothetical protein